MQSGVQMVEDLVRSGDLRVGTVVKVVEGHRKEMANKLYRVTKVYQRSARAGQVVASRPDSLMGMYDLPSTVRVVIIAQRQ